MARRLKVFATASLPPGIPLRHPIMTAAPNLDAAARALRVSVHHLSRHPFPVGEADKAKALSRPMERLMASTQAAGGRQI